MSVRHEWLSKGHYQEFDQICKVRQNELRLKIDNGRRKSQIQHMMIMIKSLHGTKDVLA